MTLKTFPIWVFFGKIFFIEKNLVFGFRHGSQIFQRISDSIRFIMSQEGHYCCNYADDFLLIDGNEKCNLAFDRLSVLLPDLGFDISHHKTVQPSTKVICLGILVDTVSFTTSIPEEKLKKIKIICLGWAKKSSCTKRQLQSLLGSLLYVSKCVRYSRFFLNRLLTTLRSMEGTYTVLDKDFHRDVAWFNRFLETFNGTSFFKKSPENFTLHLDACLTGLGGVFGNKVYHIALPEELTARPIAGLEMLNILVAVRIWAT